MQFKHLIKFIARANRHQPPVKLPASTVDFDQPRAYKQDEPHPCDAYNTLKMHFRDIGRMNAIIEILGRDFLTAMPQGAYVSRLGQMAFLFRRMHEDLTSEQIKRLIDEAKEHEYGQREAWDEWDRANLREMSHMYLMYCSVAPELMEQKARLAYEGRRHHQDVRKNGDWEQAQGFLSAQIDLHRKIAEARRQTVNEDSNYQMLMQEYMPGMSVYEIENIFSLYEGKLNNLLPQIKARQEKEKKPVALQARYAPAEQMWLNRSLLRVIGFDFERGGLYETGHNPVEGGTPEDTRLVIYNVDQNDFLDSMRSALHEGGHGLYIQGLPRHAWRYQPVAMDLGAAVHESQALLIEMIIGRMPEFYEFLSPRLEGLFQGSINAPALAPSNLFALRTRVDAGLERRKADEVTYFYHILMRFRLERDLIEGALDIKDLPEAWNESMRQLLGVVPQNPREGCLQDVHWFVGKFGYFPSYAIGHMMAAQIFSSLKSAIPGIRRKIAAGEFDQIRDWLIENIYSKGRLLGSKDMLKQATGHKLKPDYLEKHIRARYLN